jgi:hypothetical protein
MKQFGMLVALLMTCTSMVAQQMSLAQAMNALNANSKDFTPLLGPVDKENPDNFTSTIKVKGAKESFFKKVTTNQSGNGSETLEFRAGYGGYNSISELNAFVQQLEKQVKAGLPSIQFAKTNVGEKVDNWYYWIVWDTPDRMNRMACYLEVIKKDNTYNLSFVYPLVKKGNNYKEYIGLKNEPDTSRFTMHVRNLLVEATRDFSGIKGNKVDSMKNTYRTEHLPFILMNSYIVDMGQEKAQFLLRVNSGLDLGNMKQEALDYYNMLSGALGKNYAYTISSDGLDVTFVHKQFPAVPLAIVNVSAVNSKFSIEVVFFSNRLSPALFSEKQAK